MTVLVVVLLAVLVLLAGALVPLLGRTRRERLCSNDEAIAARARHARLGYYVEDPPAVADPAAAELLGRARERWVTCGGLLADARSEQDFLGAQQVAEAGLDQVRAAYQRLGRPMS